MGSGAGNWTEYGIILIMAGLWGHSLAGKRVDGGYAKETMTHEFMRVRQFFRSCRIKTSWPAKVGVGWPRKSVLHGQI